MSVHPLIKKFYPESNLLGYTFVSGTHAFYNAINSLIINNPQEKILLNLGCGRGAFMDDYEHPDRIYSAHLQNFKGRVKKVIGIDVDQEGEINPSIDEFLLIEINKPWPIEDGVIDICVSDWVIEHVQDTAFFFSELNRVMKKGGVACFRTTNKSGYIALSSMLIPNKLHSTFLKKIQPSRKEEDVFPTVYKCNTKKKFEQTFENNGFEPFVYYHVAEPSYFTFSYLSFAFGYYFHKVLPGIFKTTIFAFGRKK